MEGIYIPVLIFVGIFLLWIVWSTSSYGEIETRHNLGYVTDIANNGSVTVNDTSFTKVLNANMDREYVMLCNKSKLSESKVVYINYRTVANSVDETGMILFGEGCEPMPPTAIYTGEITAISSTGEPLITYIEY